MKMEEHQFVCEKCGREGIPLPRQRGHKHKQGHTKHLYCVYCKETTPHHEYYNERRI